MNIATNRPSRRAARRPRDLVSLLVSLGITLLVTLIGTLAAQTTAGIDADLTTATRVLPSFVLFAINTIGATAIIFVPVLVGISLVVRGRARQLVDALLAAGLAVLALVSLSILIVESNSPRLLLALTGGTQTAGITPLDPLIAGLIAFLVIARIFDRGKIGAVATISVIALSFVSLVAGQTTIVAQIVNILLGWTIGLTVRYSLGTPINRASVEKITEALTSSGLSVEKIDLLLETSEGRIYSVNLKTGEQLNVWVFDWELQGSGVISSWWRGLTIKTSGDFRGMSIRRRIERTALLSYAISATGIRVPEVQLVREIEPDSILIALANLDGSTFADLKAKDTQLNMEQIKKFLQGVKTIHDADIAHRSLSSENIYVTQSGEITFTGVHSGTIGATELQLRVDLAEALVTAARSSSVTETVSVAKLVFSTKELIRIIPAIQSVAMSRKTREYLKSDRELLRGLRKSLGELTPSAEIQPIQFQRINWQSVLLAIASVIALYVLVPQFSQISINELISTAQWRWALVALVGSSLTYFAATALLLAFIPTKVNRVRTLQAQLAASFATLVTPPTLGSVAVNIRFLNKSGVPAPAAATAVGVSQVVIFFIHLILLLLFGVVAGTQTELSFRPPRITLVIFVIIVALVIVAFSISSFRNWVINRAKPIFNQVGPTLATIAQQPQRLLISLVSSLALNSAYIMAFYASLHAFGSEISLSVAAFVYLAGATLGQAAPTPGGIGAVEAALVAGLTAVGVASGMALSGVLLYRVVTFWLPVIPGWYSFANLQSKNLL